MNLRNVELQLMKWGIFGEEVKKGKEWVLYRADNHARVAEIYQDYEEDLAYQLFLNPHTEPDLYDEVDRVLSIAVRRWEHGG